MTRTAGPNSKNPGRQFYRCSKPPNEQCQFFEWSDAHSSQGNKYSRSEPKRTNGYNQSNVNEHASDTKGRAPRMCSICKQPGHTKTKCPNKDLI